MFAFPSRGRTLEFPESDPCRCALGGLGARTAQAFLSERRPDVYGAAARLSCPEGARPTTLWALSKTEKLLMRGFNSLDSHVSVRGPLDSRKNEFVRPNRGRCRTIGLVNEWMRPAEADPDR